MAGTAVWRPYEHGGGHRRSGHRAGSDENSSPKVPNVSVASRASARGSRQSKTPAPHSDLWLVRSPAILRVWTILSSSLWTKGLLALRSPSSFRDIDAQMHHLSRPSRVPLWCRAPGPLQSTQVRVRSRCSSEVDVLSARVTRTCPPLSTSRIVPQLKFLNRGSSVRAQ